MTWLPDVDAGPFRFGPHDPRTPLARLTDDELKARARASLPAVVETWRHGTPEERDRARVLLRRAAGVDSPPEALAEYPFMRTERADLVELLTADEWGELEGTP